MRADGGEVETVLRRGEAAPALIAEASARRARLIVLATHGRSGLGRWIYGSVADEVMRAADALDELEAVDAG